MSIHNKKKKLQLNSTSVDLGCSCRRTTTKLFRFFSLKSTSTAARTTTSSSSASFRKQILPSTTTTSSSDDPSSYYSSLQYLLDAESAFKAAAKPVKGFGRIDGEGVAVEKDSDDPYLDFRHSMLQMILENGIYSKQDMRELLNCFLQLNSPYYHGVIVRAFTEIWNGVFSVKSPAAAPASDTSSNYYSSPGAAFSFGYYNSSWEC